MKTIRAGLVMVSMLAASQVFAADELWFGLHGGPSIPRLSDGGNEISRGYSSRLAPNFGVAAEYAMCQNWSLQLEVNYSSQGGERDGLQPITQTPSGLPLPPNQLLYADFKNESILNYLEIPLMLKWHTDCTEHWRCFAEGGAFIGYLLNAEERTRGSSPIYLDSNRTPLPMTGGMAYSLDSNTDVANGLHDINWGVTAGIGIAYLITPQHQLFFDLRGEYGLRAVAKDTATNGNSSTGDAVFSFGYMFNFGR